MEIVFERCYKRYLDFVFYFRRMQEHSIVYSLHQIEEIAERLLQFADEKKIFLFEGEMGSGKTTLIKKLCEKLQADTSLSSPTYSIVNEYPIRASSVKIYHMDLYRLKDMQEALAIGIEEYLFSENYCFIEWAALIEPMLRDEAVKVQLSYIDENSRKITIFKD